VTNTGGACLTATGGSELTTTTLCADASANMIYLSTPGDSTAEPATTGTCETKLSSQTFMKIKCTNASTCSVAEDTETSFLIYDYNGTTLTQITSKLYYDSTGSKLYSCDANGSCSVAADKTYHLSSTNSNEAENTDTIVTVSGGTATPGANGKYYYLTTSNSNEETAALYLAGENGAATQQTNTETVPKYYYFTNTESNLGAEALISVTTDAVSQATAGYYYLTGGGTGNSNLPDNTNYLISVNAAGAVTKETSEEDTKYYYLTPTDSPILASPTTQLIRVTTEGAATQAPALAYYLDSTNSNLASGSEKLVTVDDELAVTAETGGEDAEKYYYYADGESNLTGEALIKVDTSGVASKAEAKAYFLDENNSNQASGSEKLVTVTAGEGGALTVTAEAGGTESPKYYYYAANGINLGAEALISVTSSVASKAEAKAYYLDSTNSNLAAGSEKLVTVAGTDPNLTVTAETGGEDADKYYYYASGETNLGSVEALIKVDTSGVASKAEAKAYFLDENNSNQASGSEKLVTVTAGEGGALTVTAETGSTDPKYYYYEASGINLNAISLISVTDSVVTLIETEGYYYLTSNNSNLTADTLINVNSTAVDKVTTVGYYFLPEDNESVSAITVLNITDTTGAVAAVAGEAGNCFLNEAEKNGESYKSIIKYDSAFAKANTTDDAGFYPNSAVASGLPNSIIQCEVAGDILSCGAVPSPVAGVYINKGDTATPAKQLITCNESGCVAGPPSAEKLYFVDVGTPEEAKRGEEQYYTNLIYCVSTSAACTSSPATAGFYINGIAVTDGAKLTNALIECTGTTVGCRVVPSVEPNSIYLNAVENESSKILIQCSDATNGCQTIESGASDTGFKYYVNAGNSTAPLIRCSDASTCDSISVDLGDASELYFVNANYGTAAPKDTENYLIRYTSESCATYKNPATPVNGVKYHYIHGEPDTDDKLSKSVIECLFSNTETPCTLPDTIADLDVYIDSSDVNNIIRCFEEIGCASTPNDATRTTSAFYISKTDLIKCYSDSGCDIVPVANLTAVAGKKVFLNANFGGENADTENQLIKCDTEGACALAASSASANVTEFYVNADTKSDGSDYDGATKTEIIRCAVADDGVVCDTNLTTKENDVFVNANFNTTDTTPLHLIKCTSTDCVEEAATIGDAPAYYVNAGASSSEKLTDTLIECADSDEACEVVEAEEKDIYINALDQQLIICKDASTGCKAVPSTATAEKYQYFLNSSDLKSEGQEVFENDLIKCSVSNNTRICEPAKGEENMVYINSFDPSTVISCVTEEGCSATNSTAEENKPQFFVNGGDIPDGEPLKLDLIKCTLKKSSGKSDGEGSISCDITSGKVGDVYLNGNSDDTENQLIICSEEEGCVGTPVTLGVESQATSEMETATPVRREAEPTPDTTYAVDDEAAAGEQSSPAPNYYLNSGNEGKDKFEYALIQCASGDDNAVTCDLYKAAQYQVYVNSNEIDNANVPLIKCAKNACSKTASAATETSKEYYINAGDIDETPLNYDIIECAFEDDTVKCTCKAEADTNEGVYVNSNYSESGDNKQLIQCSSDNGCVGVATVEKGVEYYVNAESTDLNNAIIFCSNKKCEKQTPAAVPMYYIGKDGDNVNGLIKCVKSTPPAERRRKRDDEERCTLTSAFTSEGYYLNSGYNKSTNQTIICDSTEGCSTVKVDLGFYVNAGNEEKKIIKCEKEGNECEEEDTKSCPSAEKAVPGNYCYEDGQLKFFTANNSTAITASKSDDTYAFATIPSNGFPGIKSEIGSLFKISRYFINRFYQSGVVMIDKNGKLVDSLGGDTSDISLYDCNDSTKVCTERPGCTSNTYMFDSENRKAVFCNDGNLEYASFTGYVVDGNRVTSGTKHPYIIQCENGEKCVSLKPKSSTYYENSGYDSTTNSLIQCNNSNCMTVAAEVGYYVAHGHTDNNGVIKCTTATSCSYSQVKNKVKYVNAGFDKRNNAIIECKGGKCSVAKAKSGYYLTHTSTLLIQCTSPTSCAEFTPTVNYYDNADSSESSNTIINCVQNSNVVTCSSEATNNGFYMSSISNVLIRCKAGHKCKTITVKNGIFRGALKGLTSNKRSDNAQNVQNVHGRDDDDLEEDGKMVNLRDNSDDAYGIIRCVAGKCAALSASELAAIPMCEFNNNKCYITLEYAMTKSATTSIAAGNICTNSDRSVFYFATDTVVVKPNVISGVTSTYVYTTTNSNCLEVNDSYNDMYFTVGSNIYTLDQGSVLQFYETGYYFLNVAKNTLVGGNEIDAYNDENVKLYRCNGSSCSIIDKPDANTYYADVNKRILKYNVNNDVFTFAYEKDIICIFANNKCTPNADLKNQEFCITYKGEIVLATTDIKNRETGECYRAGNINNYIYGYSQHLYHMNQFAAEMVDQTGFYIISLSTNTTVVSKNYKNKNNSIVVYGCNLSSCRVYEPDEDTYYYDAQARNILRYKNGVWSSPSTSGYAYIAIDPTNTYVYKFVKKGDEIIIQGKANYGYYYTVDNEMYHCDQEDGECKPIDETGYYFTNAGEVFSCVHDSEGLEATECVKQNCVSGQYYYIDDAYYRCEVSSLLVPVVSRYCSYDDNVVVNFPLALTEEFPDKIKQAVDDIQKNNNSTAVVTRRGKNYLEAVSGIFTNCTYNVEETKSTFDLVCVNNYVRVDDETDEVKICNVDQLGYVECIEDEDNPEKCSVSAAFTILKPSIFTFFVLLFVTAIFHF